MCKHAMQTDANMQAVGAYARQQQKDGVKGIPRVKMVAEPLPVMLFGYGVSKLRGTAYFCVPSGV